LEEDFPEIQQVCVVNKFKGQVGSHKSLPLPVLLFLYKMENELKELVTRIHDLELENKLLKAENKRLEEFIDAYETRLFDQKNTVIANE
jgi:hypothetical protein